jgi:hypothetical protein
LSNRSIASVRVVQRIRYLDRDPHRFVDAELGFPLELVAQRLALDVGHDVIEESVGGARIEQREDVGVLQLGGGLDLLDEPLGTEHGRELGSQDLEGDLTVVPHVQGEIDRGHPTRAHLALDQVVAAEGGGEPAARVGHGGKDGAADGGGKPCARRDDYAHARVAGRRRLGVHSRATCRLSGPPCRKNALSVPGPAREVEASCER